MGSIRSIAGAARARAIAVAGVAFVLASAPAGALTVTPPDVERPLHRIDVAAGPEAAPADVLRDDLRVTLDEAQSAAGAGSVLFSNFEQGGFGFAPALPAPRLAED
jgi:hypothetical protein